MPVISLLNNNVFIFTFIVIIGSILISIYYVIMPENSIPYNFNPFPKQTPSALPDPTRQTDTCWNSLTPCDAQGQCSACSLGEYKCVNVSEDEGNNKYYHFNGINVPKGNWCLPADNNPNPLCNSYTGRWLWTFDPEYCNNISPGSSQCWKCECLYPSLYSDSTNGCVTQLACQNDSILTQSLSQPGNQLIASTCAPTGIQGQVWNPLSGTDSPVLTFSPYDKDKNGNPLFICNCQDNSNDQYFARLPGDPHTCHLEPCFKYLASREKGLECDNDSCNLENCSCNCDETNFAKSPNGKYTNTCVLISDSCGQGGFSNGNCECGGGPLWDRECKNTNTGVNMNNPSLPDCILPQNALGSECINPCENATCNHGAPCISCGKDSFRDNDICFMAPDGSILTDPANVHSLCDCSAATDNVPPGYGGFYGSTCSILCLPGGTRLKSWVFGVPSGDNSCNCCCSQNSYIQQKLWVLNYSEYCSDGTPSILQPADPSCLPVPEYSCDIF